MGRRDRNRPRCFGCGLNPTFCFCAEMPRVRLSTSLAIVQHTRETNKPTSTGRLLARMVEGAALLPFGMRGIPFDPGPLADPSIDWLLLFPRKGVPDLEPRRPSGRRLGLVLLDGTWKQAARMSYRVPGIDRFPCVSLPPGGPSFWSVRHQHHERGRSTFEAALDALERIEGPDRTAVLREAFARVTARLLHLKGQLKSAEVPASWR